jgi:hypothetical protein
MPLTASFKGAVIIAHRGRHVGRSEIGFSFEINWPGSSATLREERWVKQDGKVK